MSDRLRFLPRIESLRGLAALAVALMHVTSSWVGEPATGGALDAMGLKAIKALSNGYGAVVAFFVISGCVLARSLDRDLDAWRFVKARAFRLFPAAITTVGIFAFLYYAFGFKLYARSSFEPLNVVANMLMVRADIDAVMWSMKAELAATPLIFLCVVLCRRHGQRPLIAVAALLFGLSFLGQYAHAIGTDTNLAPLFAFPVGILVHFRGEALARRLPSPMVMPAAAASVLVFCACSFFKPEGTFILLVECLSAATLVMLVAYRTETLAFAPLDLGIVRFYGKISYSFYLLHPLSLWLTARLIGYWVGHHPGLALTPILVLSFVVSLVLITPLAYVSWRYVERPPLDWRAARQPRRATVVSGDAPATP